MAEEAWNLREHFHQYHAHHPGWKHCILHGLAPDKNEHSFAYGYKTEDEAPYHWLEDSKSCPKTVAFIKSLPYYEKLYRVRYTMLIPGGYMQPHRDQYEHDFRDLNVSLLNPPGSEFFIDHGGVVDMTPGSMVSVNKGYQHCIWNHGKSPRIHLMIGGKLSTDIGTPP
jgi:hypothetical protein